MLVLCLLKAHGDEKINTLSGEYACETQNEESCDIALHCDWQVCLLELILNEHVWFPGIHAR